MSNFFKSRQLGLIFAAFVFAGDVLTKQLILANTAHLPIEVIQNMFHLIFVWNRGVSFSFLSQADWVYLPWALSAFALLMSLIFIWWMPQEKRWQHQVGLGFIVGGALGNMVDRLVHGAVVDFLYVYYGTWHFPAFNVADSCITLGVILLFWDSLCTIKRTR